MKNENITGWLPSIVGKGYKDFWNCKKRFRVVKGSRGSKKSTTTALNLITRIMEYPLANLLVVRQVEGTMGDKPLGSIGVLEVESFAVRIGISADGTENHI